MKLRITSYNIRLCIEQGVHAVADVLNELGADIVTLQEVGRFWNMGPSGDLTEALAESCGYTHHVFVPALFDGPGAYGIALLSRYAIVHQEKIELPRRDDEQRVLCRAEIETAGDRSLYVWTSHLSIAGWDRNQQIRWLGEAMRDAPPDIFLGDINTEPSDPGLQRWPLTNAWSNPPQKTYPARSPDKTLDSIFFGPEWTVEQETSTLDVLASDHLPITATLRRKQHS